ncbi:2-succinyl-5-enolpyruvyl-6-hydroxy-3-cyclohexene-1-carboxylic-acid synthase [Alkalimarinus coralli]|uniref:2-succinyl-5-enolpyruvyl-6-hydroxy-3- cyclohexene-1-carboxylic-acid synthase n=1 Tax=Alkalimarinus coralli TaxID=2935863 RepID=UPI00202B0C9B|nr:2-succinyl-5-enolpyruvyl-6-hydroxy-3-cyclohexene-1-carboxylic-acid synthase [Alkalimarinus coralli]
MIQQITHITNLWAHFIVNTLITRGVYHFCIAPGSRSAPLTLALTALKSQYLESDQKNIELHTHFDERGLGFYALGISKSTQTPVAIITTSGTAVANLHPAVIESYQTQTPLIILSADRPPELLGCGANQAINQQQLFSGNVAHFQQLDLPARDLPLYQLVKSINQCMEYAVGAVSGIDPGPVHINCPFREPLYGDSDLQDYSDYIATYDEMARKQAAEQLSSATWSVDYDIAKFPKHSSNTLIIAGAISKAESDEVLALSRSTGWPIVADISSQLRLNGDTHIFHYADLIMASKASFEPLNAIEQVIQFGGRITSKRINQWVGRFKGEYKIVSRFHEKLDPHHKALQVKVPIEQYCNQVTYKGRSSSTSNILTRLNKKLDCWIDRELADGFSELSVVRTLSCILPAGTALFVGNSLSIRLMDMFAAPANRNPVYSNRGASGIDGVLATAIGSALNHPRGLTLLIGDTSLLHDLNSLSLARNIATPLVIIVLNNDGGSIFNLLPIDNQQDLKEAFFRCPHGLSFEAACQMFSINYVKPNSLESFKLGYLEAIDNNHCTLIEIAVPSDQATSKIKQIIQQVENLPC